MKKLFFSVLMTSLVAISCKKDDSPAPALVEKYMSLSSGSTWNYELTNNIIPATSNYTLSSSAKDTTINARGYHIFTNSNASTGEYYNISGNDYYNFRSLPVTFGNTSIEFIYLKDNTAVGNTWSQSAPVTVSGIPLIVTLTNTITAKGLTKIVKGVTYNNVIHVTTTITVSASGVPLPASALVTDIHSFYAEKFGLIQYINKIDLNYFGLTDKTDQLTSLISADIK